MQGARVLGLMTLGLRYMYCKKEIHSVDDLKGAQGPRPGDQDRGHVFPAYGAQVVHMPFGDVYTSLQTGVVDFAENGINVYVSNKHYEVAPIMSLSEHEANNASSGSATRLWNSLSDEQKGWVQAAADEVGKTQPAKAMRSNTNPGEAREDGHQVRQGRRQGGFIKIAEPLQDQIAKELGPHAVKILAARRAP